MTLPEVQAHTAANVLRYEIARQLNAMDTGRERWRVKDLVRRCAERLRAEYHKHAPWEYTLREQLWKEIVEPVWDAFLRRMYLYVVTDVIKLEPVNDH